MPQNLECPSKRKKVGDGFAWGFSSADAAQAAKDQAEADAKTNAQNKGGAQAKRDFECGHYCDLKYDIVITSTKSAAYQADPGGPHTQFIALAVVDYDLYAWCEETRDAALQLMKAFEKMSGGNPR